VKEGIAGSIPVDAPSFGKNPDSYVLVESKDFTLFGALAGKDEVAGRVYFDSSDP